MSHEEENQEEEDLMDLDIFQKDLFNIYKEVFSANEFDSRQFVEDLLELIDRMIAIIRKNAYKIETLERLANIPDLMKLVKPIEESKKTTGLFI